MTSPSMQFAPAWLKKPNGTATSGSTNSAGGTPSSNLAFSQAVASAPTIGHLQHSSQNEDPTGLSGFPLPGSRQGGATSTNTGATNALGQSYSQIASPRNESFPSSNQGFGASIASASVQLGDQVNGSYNAGNNKARPFRYSRETMIALFDEDKIRERPLELMEWAMVRSNNSGHAGKENEGVTSIILSDKAGIPMGLVEWTAEEKKVSSASFSFTLSSAYHSFCSQSALCQSHSTTTCSPRPIRLIAFNHLVLSPKRTPRQHKRDEDSRWTRIRPR